jgi:hypothetical protein
LEAAQKAQQVDSNATLQQIREASQAFSEAIQDAKRATEQQQKRAEELTNAPKSEDKRARENLANQAEQIADETRKTRGRDADNLRNHWDSLAKQADQRAKQAQNQKRSAEKQVDRLEGEVKKHPDNESLKTQLNQQQAEAQRAREWEAKAKETQAIALNQKKEAERAAAEIRNTPLPKIKDEPHPAAELASQMNQQATEELNKLEQSLAQLAERARFDQNLRVPESSANWLQRRQLQLNDEVKLAAEMLSRAARHEERLGHMSQSNELDRASSNVGQTAEATLKETASSLENSREHFEQSVAAQQNLSRAATELAKQAAAVREMLAQQDSSPDDQDGSNKAGAPSNAEKLARTLDELDRQVNSRPTRSTNPSSKSSQGEASQQPSDGSNNGSSKPTAGEASQTLANAANEQAQRAAKQRQSQTESSQPGQYSGNQQGEQSSSDASGQGAFSTSDPATTGPGGGIGASHIQRVGDDWGRLRERRTENAVEDQSEQIPSGYRREIEAYFRAIAERAGR